MAAFNPQCITYSQMNMIFNARFYYRRLTTWTRAYLMSRYFGIGTEEALFGRLYSEALNIGNMMHIIFGRQAKEQNSQMSSEYAIAFNQLITARLAGDTEAVRQNIDRLYRNVAERAAFLENMNPYWSAAEYTDLFNAYIRHSIETANAILSGNSAREIELYDLLSEHTNRMGDVFAQGLYSYITSGIPSSNTYAPSQGGEPCITFEQMNNLYAIRLFWFELATWIRIYMISRYTGTGHADQVFAKLMQILDSYVDTLKEFFPDMDEEVLLQLLTEYIELISAFITAMQENDTEELNRLTVSLYENGDKRSAFISSINPFWDYKRARDILRANNRNTIEESHTFLTREYEKNIDIFTAILDQAETANTFLAEGFFNYITQPQQMQQTGSQPKQLFH